MSLRGQSLPSWIFIKTQSNGVAPLTDFENGIGIFRSAGWQGIFELNSAPPGSAKICGELMGLKATELS